MTRVSVIVKRMTVIRFSDAKPGELAIFARLLTNSEGNMSPRLARYVLTLGFTGAEQARINELADRNQRAYASPEEHDELMSYVKAGHLLALLHSHARKTLKKRKVS
jgi:hypothetical protein